MGPAGPAAGPPGLRKGSPLCLARQLLASLLLLAVILVGPVRAADGPARVMLVLDASGSMWQKLGERYKIEIAREVVRDLVGTWDDGVALGLTAYGHRRRGDCADIEVVVPSAKVDRAAFVKKVEDLSPQGSTPLVEAVRAAAKSLAWESRPATVILVTDGLESCRGDPCALAAELEAAGADFTTHVVGFDLTEAQQAKVRCLAEGTGGQFLAAADASQLRDSLTAAARAAGAVWVGARVRASLGEEVPAEVLEDAWYTVLDAGGKQVGRVAVAGHFFSLPPGTYRARVEVEAVRGEVEFEVTEDGGADVVVPLAGGLVQTRAEASTPSVKADASQWFAYRLEGGKPSAEPVSRRLGVASEAVFVLPPGSYRVVARSGHASTSRDVEVTAGAVSRAEFRYTIGSLYVAGRASKGSTEDVGSQWFVYPYVDGKPAATTSIWAKYDVTSKTFQVPTGRYRLVAKYGNVSRSQDVEVREGETTEATVVFDVGTLTAVGREAPGASGEVGYAWTIYPMQGETVGGTYALNTLYKTRVSAVLGAGKYRVWAKWQGKVVEEDVEIGAGEKKSLDVVFGR